MCYVKNAVCMVEKKNCKRGGELDSGIFMFILEKLRVTHVQLAEYIYIYFLIL
jgi:hypothetical protein